MNEWIFFSFLFFCSVLALLFLFGVLCSGCGFPFSFRGGGESASIDDP
jgi:hypothetical protein